MACSQAFPNCLSPIISILAQPRRANHSYNFRQPASIGGALAIVTNVGRDAVDAAALTRASRSQGGFPVSDQERARRTAPKRTAKPCGPGTRCWCQVGGDMSTQPGADMSLIRQ